VWGFITQILRKLCSLDLKDPLNRLGISLLGSQCVLYFIWACVPLLGLKLRLLIVGCHRLFSRLIFLRMKSDWVQCSAHHAKDRGGSQSARPFFLVYCSVLHSVPFCDIMMECYQDTQTWGAVPEHVCPLSSSVMPRSLRHFIFMMSRVYHKKG
jgi:hypothetical protein